MAPPTTPMRVFHRADADTAKQLADGRPATLATFRLPSTEAHLGRAYVPASPTTAPGEPRDVGDPDRVQAGQLGFWERHDGGDEVLVVLSGRATFTASADDQSQTLEVTAGDIVYVPQHVAHSVRVHEALDVIFILPTTLNATWHDHQRS